MTDKTMVMGILVAISVFTGCLHWKDCPKSPWNIFRIQRKYCCHMGLSNPYCRLRLRTTDSSTSPICCCRLAI